MIGRQGPAATLRQHCPQMTHRHCMCILFCPSTFYLGVPCGYGSLPFHDLVLDNLVSVTRDLEIFARVGVDPAGEGNVGDGAGPPDFVSQVVQDVIWIFTERNSDYFAAREKGRRRAASNLGWHSSTFI